MKPIIATASARGTDPANVAGKLAGALKSQLQDKTPALLMIFASVEQNLAELQPAVQTLFPQTTILGSTTAGEFTERGESQGAVVAWALSGDFQIDARIGLGLSDNLESIIEKMVRGLADPREGYPHHTALILLDPLSGNAEEATLLASALLGENVRLAGGAAADGLAMKKTWVGLGSQVESNAVVIAVIHSKTPIGIGVCHGHTPLSDPLKVTRAEKNVVYEIQGKPAWQAWTEATAARVVELGIDISNLTTSEEVFDYLNRFEAGLKLGDEYKVRVPMAKGDDGSLHFACGIPENTVLRVMESVNSRQIESAREAVRRSRGNLGAHEIAGAVVFDCSCRKTILKDEFGAAVEAMREELGGAPLAGFETYGEIAMEIGEMSGFHNTTTVVVTFGR
ncbi:MAG: FIST C-terminal domain-containing protein [Proteobacteria bacterium]|nr:FIST C-terminal domain-containing protein [Pseudomonadota bacterium]